MAERNHDNCGAGCYWCALQRATKARSGSISSENVLRGASTAQVIGRDDYFRDLDQITNFLGDLIAGVGVQGLEQIEPVFALVQNWLGERVSESVSRNLANPAWRAAMEQAKTPGRPN